MTQIQAIVLLSGGIDSMACLAISRDHGEAIYALTIDYGQRARKEIDAARNIVDRVRGTVTIEHEIAFVGVNDSAHDRWALRETPEWIPARNLVLLSVALNRALAVGAGKIYIGTNAGDHMFPDSTELFLAGFAELARISAAQVGSADTIQIERPFINYAKRTIVSFARSSGLPIDATWSCYADGEAPCNRCKGCTSRRSAGGDD